MNDRLGPLEDLTRILLDAELARLRQLSYETRLRQDEIARLSAGVTARAAEAQGLDPATDLAWRTGQDAPWQAWVAREKRRLSREAADMAARREAQLKKAQRAFGKVEAMKAIRAAEDEALRVRSQRRRSADPDGLGNCG